MGANLFLEGLLAGALLPIALLGTWLAREVLLNRRLACTNADLLDRLMARNLAEYKQLATPSPAETPAEPRRDEMIDDPGYSVVGPTLP